MIKKLKLPLSKLVVNENNPRYIRETEFDELYRSILEFPEMSEASEIVVNQDYVIIGGTMRYHAMKKAGWKEASVVIVDWSEEKQQEFIVKDNLHDGMWDYSKLAEKWDIEEASKWGIDTTKWEHDFEEENRAYQSEEADAPVDTVTCPYCATENPRYE